MSKTKRRFKIANSMVFAITVAVIVNILCVSLIVVTSRYASIHPDFYLIFLGVLVSLTLILNILLLTGYGKRILWMRRAFVLVGSVVILISGIATYYVVRINNGFDNLVNVDNKEIVEYALITLNPEITDKTVPDNARIGYVSGDTKTDESVNEHIRNYTKSAQMVERSDYGALLADYLEATDKLDIIVVPAQYRRLAENMDKTLQEKLESSTVVGSFNISLDADFSNVNVTEEPFTVLLTGLNDNLSDTIIMASVNPKTFTIALTSIARDSYVPIACYANNSFDKINHARGRSRQCLIDTVENYLDVEVDYYFETDFYALEKIVDSIGGLEITSPISFGGSYPLENSKEYREIYIRAGTYVMDGGEVVTFARERHHFPAGDFDRQMNQQYVIKTLAYRLIDEAKTNPNILVNVLESAKNNIEMNLSMERDIAPLFGYFLKTMSQSPVSFADTFTVYSTQIVGPTPNINGVSVITPSRGSVLEVRSILKQNLGLEPITTLTKKMSFSINNPYVGYEFNRYIHQNSGLMYPQGGSGTTEVPTDPETPTTPTSPETPSTQFTVPDLTSMTLTEAQAWADKNGVKLSKTIVEKVDDANNVFIDGQIIWQKKDPGVYETAVDEIVISVVKLVPPTDGNGGDTGTGETGTNP